MQDAIGILVLAVHLLAMNVAAAGPLVCASLIHGGNGDPFRTATYRRTARDALTALAVGGALGGLMLWAPSPGLRAALARFPSSAYWFAGIELAFSAACMTALLVAERPLRRRPALAWLAALASASNLLYHFPPMMAVVGKLAADPRWTHADVLSRRQLVQLASRPEIAALWIHFILASIAASTIFALRPSKLEPPPPMVPPHAAMLRRLAAAALAATALQLPSGIWLLIVSRAEARDAILGGDAAASASFVAGLVAALALVHGLIAAALGDVAAGARRRIVWLLAAAVLAMAATLSLSGRETISTGKHAHVNVVRKDADGGQTPSLGRR